MAPIYIGLITGAVCYLALNIKQIFKFNDSLDVITVHLVGGLLGSLLLGFFADASINSAVTHEGVFLGGGVTLLGDRALRGCSDAGVLVHREPHPRPDHPPHDRAPRHRGAGRGRSRPQPASRTAYTGV